MPPHDHLYSSVPNDGVSRLNNQRASLVHWIVGRFHTLYLRKEKTMMPVILWMSGLNGLIERPI